VIPTLALDRALARQSLDALARQFVRLWKPKSPDKSRTARSFAGELRKLAKGQVTWFQNRPEASKLLAKILGGTPARLGLQFTPYEIQSRDSSGWGTNATRQTIEEAEELAWSLLTRHGGQWRVRQGNRTIASGSGYRSCETPYSHDRTAVWSRVVHKDAAAKKRKAP